MLLKQLGNGELFVFQRERCARHDNAVKPRTNAVATGHKTRPGRGAAGFDKKLGEHKAFSRQCIKAWGRRAQHGPAAVGTDIAKTEIVGEHEHHIRSLSALRY